MIHKRRTALAVVGVSAGLALLGLTANGIYGQESAQTGQGNAPIQVGTLVINLEPGTSVPWQQQVSGFAPGDATTKYIDVVNAGSATIKTVTVAAATAGALTTGPHPLTTTWEVCASAFTTEGTCPGGASTVITGATATQGAPGDLGIAPAPGKAAHLRLTSAMPADGGNEYQGASADTTFTFTATQDTEAAQ